MLHVHKTGLMLEAGISEPCAFKTYIMLLHYLRVFLLNFQLQKTKLDFPFFLPSPDDALRTWGCLFERRLLA